MKFLKMALLAGSLVISAFAAEATKDTANHFQRFAALPVLGYAEETGLKYGAMLILFTHPDLPGSNATSFDFAVMGTTKGQLEVTASPDLYLLYGLIHSDITLTYWNWRAKYYGVGNDPDRDMFTRYDMDLFKVIIPVDIGFIPVPQVARFFSAGPYFYFEKNNASFKNGNVPEPDEKGGVRNGFGYQVTLGLRDNVNWPVAGIFGQFRQVAFGAIPKRDAFYKQTLDLRAYAPLFWRISFATGFLYETVLGHEIPFDMLSTLDGIKRFRGVERGMFLDKQVVTFQAELRKELFWRLAGTIFFESGKVGPYFSKLLRNDSHYAVGFGGRLLLNKKEKTHARGDISLVDGKYIGLTVYLREAF